MIEKIKDKIKETKNKILVGSVVAPLSVVSSALPAFASGTNDTTANITTGMTGFMNMVTSMLDVILGSASLQIAFAASFAFLAVRLVRKLKKG